MAKLYDLEGNEIRETVGKKAADKLVNPEKAEIGETTEGVTKEYMDNIIKAAEDGLKAHYEGDFYVCAQRKRERTLVNVLRTLYYHRESKPSPMWDMDCWRVNQNGDLFFCWSLPDMQTGHDMMDNPNNYLPECRDLVQFVWQFVNDMM